MTVILPVIDGVSCNAAMGEHLKTNDDARHTDSDLQQHRTTAWKRSTPLRERKCGCDLSVKRQQQLPDYRISIAQMTIQMRNILATVLLAYPSSTSCWRLRRSPEQQKQRPRPRRREYVRYCSAGCMCGVSLDGSVDAFPEVEIMGLIGAEAREFWPE